MCRCCAVRVPWAFRQRSLMSVLTNSLQGRDRGGRADRGRLLAQPLLPQEAQEVWAVCAPGTGGAAALTLLLSSSVSANFSGASRPQRGSVTLSVRPTGEGKHLNWKDELACCASRALTHCASRFSTASTLGWGPSYSVQRWVFTINTACTPRSSSEQTSETHRNQRSAANFRQNEVHLQEEDARCAQCCDSLIRKWPRHSVTSSACVLTQGDPL